MLIRHLGNHQGEWSVNIEVNIAFNTVEVTIKIEVDVNSRGEAGVPSHPLFRRLHPTCTGIVQTFTTTTTTTTALQQVTTCQDTQVQAIYNVHIVLVPFYFLLITSTSTSTSTTMAITLPPPLDWIPINLLTIAAFIVGIIFTSLACLLPLFAFTLPDRFDPSSPPTLDEKVFSESDKLPENANRSGYTSFLSAQKRQQSSSSQTNKSSFHSEPTSKIQCPTSVQVLVLGELGRSPRMQYHALSLARRGVLVSLIGDMGTAELHPDLAANRFVQIYPLSTFPKNLQFSNRILFLTVTAPAKILWQITSLYQTLSYAAPASTWLLLQNPPAIPTLLIARLVALTRDTNLVVDWHNFGYTILALRLGPRHIFVKFAEWYEGFFSRGAAAHFAVSDAMKAALKRKWGIRAQTLHDRPAEIFQPLTKISERENFLRRLEQTADHAEQILRGEKRLLVSSTSWTPDEDFELLLQGLVQYAKQREEQLLSSATSPSSSPPPLPAIHAIITGRGPLLTHYLSRISTLQTSGLLPGISIENAWLTPSDYALLLSSADLGISLHMSSSGVDLPMKVVDMFGSGLPVVGWSGFESWGELVREPEKATAGEGDRGDGDEGNGRGFQSAEELCKILEELFGEVDEEGRRVGWTVDGSDDGGDDAEERERKLSQLERLRRGARKEGKRRWEDEWKGVAGRLFGLEK
jgi:beta-1,4-mannosyltransferase